MLLGDAIESALSSVGISKQRVETWLGECRCTEKRDKLNALDAWARRVVSGKVDKARYYLEQLCRSV